MSKYWLFGSEVLEFIRPIFTLMASSAKFVTPGGVKICEDMVGCGLVALIV